MPAKRFQRVTDGGTFFHVYNRGIENRIIFNDHQDYETFQSFLKDYLSAPPSRESTRRVFTIHGRAFQGSPHQPKNYFNKVELIAYRLTPTHFHLIVHQRAPRSLENFIRSLCTRYSIYYNKKHQHTGSLFERPYKSLHIKDSSQLINFTRYLHRKPDNGEEPASIYSSYPEYLGKKQSPWLNTNIVLSGMRIEDYRNFVEKYRPDQEEKCLLEGLPLERSILESNAFSKPSSTVPEIFGITSVFLLLLGLGLRNINTSTAHRVTAAATTKPTVLSTSTQPTDSPKSNNMVVIKITDGSEMVNIRQKPTINSEKIGVAMDGDTFEFSSVNSGWYEVKLSGGSIGYISSMYAFSVEPNNQ